MTQIRIDFYLSLKKVLQDIKKSVKLTNLNAKIHSSIYFFTAIMLAYVIPKKLFQSTKSRHPFIEFKALHIYVSRVQKLYTNFPFQIPYHNPNFLPTKKSSIIKQII